MEINKGKIYVNRAWKYLYPALRVYGDNPINYLNLLTKSGVGIFDVNHEDDDDEDIPKLYVLIQTQDSSLRGTDKTKYEKLVAKFFEFTKDKDYLLDDYIYKIDKEDVFHMLVFSLPDNFREKLVHFKKGDFSKMYSKEEVEKYFTNKKLRVSPTSSLATFCSSLGNNLEVHSVLLKSRDFRSDFVKNINEEFSTNLTLEDLPKDAELDYKPLLKEEGFNY